MKCDNYEQVEALYRRWQTRTVHAQDFLASLTSEERGLARAAVWVHSDRKLEQALLFYGMKQH